MSCKLINIPIIIFILMKQFSESAGSFYHRRILTEGSSSVYHTHDGTSGTKATPHTLKKDEPVAGAEAAVLIIVVIVVLSVIGMVIYFMRKFDQLNRSLPTYRYSSLKTEVNGVYGDDDKTESQVLVSVSTEEEDYEDDEEEDYVSPPTLLVRSQTIIPIKSVNGSVPAPVENSTVASNPIKSGAATDSDDELLQ